MPSGNQGIEANVDEIKLKDSFTDKKKTKSLAKALKKRISKLSVLDKSTENTDKYPTFTIEDWEVTSNQYRNKDTVEDDKSEYEVEVDNSEKDNDSGEEKMSFRSNSLISDTSERNHRLSVDSATAQQTGIGGGRGKYYKRLSICDDINVKVKVTLFNYNYLFIHYFWSKNNMKFETIMD